MDHSHQAHRLCDLVLREILLSRQRARSHDPKIIEAYAHLWYTIARLGPLQRYYPRWREALERCLCRPRRTSSLVETVNSPLRTLQQIHRNPSQRLLDLYAIRHDMTPFARGCKRQGISPFQQLGVDLGTDNWLEALRTYRTAS